MWLPKVSNCEPWLSGIHIVPGEWTPQLQRAIRSCDAGVVCLTPENLGSEWLHFESGGIACRSDGSLIIPFCLDVAAKHVKLPLGSYQVCEATIHGTRKMVHALSSYQQPSVHRVFSDVDQRVDEHFPELETRFAAIREECGPGLVMPFSIPVEVGLEITKLIDNRTKELVVVGQNLYGLIHRGRFLERVAEFFIERPDFRALFILAPPEYFNVLTRSRADRRQYQQQFRSSIQGLKRLRSSLRSDAQDRLRVFAHPGACSLSAIFCDPSEPSRGVVAFTPKWATDASPDSRIVCVVRRSENDTLFHGLFGHISIMNDPVHSRGLDDLLK